MLRPRITYCRQRSRPRAMVLRASVLFVATAYLLGSAAVCSPKVHGQASSPTGATASSVDAPVAPDVEPALPAQEKIVQEVVEQDAGDNGFRSADVAAASQWASSVTPVDWLGPLAPIALSPFFGITLLSGLAMWGPDFVSDNSLLSAATPLQNPKLFWAFLAMTIITSVPRFTKVSKPFAQAVDFVETYSVIIILLVIKFITTTGEDSVEPTVALQAGMFQFTADALLSLAMIINVVVINAVKYFFEFLIWVTPIPLLDAIFETCNKLACISLMGLYAFSPTLATIVNLILLAICGLVFRWTSRHVRFYRTMAIDPMLSWLFKSWGTPKEPQLVIFPRARHDPFPAKGRIVLRHDATGWTLTEHRWFLPRRELRLEKGMCTLHIRGGRLTNDLRLRRNGQEEVIFMFSRRYWSHLPAVAEALGAELEPGPLVVPPRDATVKAGLA